MVETPVSTVSVPFLASSGIERLLSPLLATMTLCAPSQHQLNKSSDADGALEQLGVGDVRVQFAAQEFSQFVKGGLGDVHTLSVKRDT